jgi:hypothetical protein
LGFALALFFAWALPSLFIKCLNLLLKKLCIKKLLYATIKVGILFLIGVYMSSPLRLSEKLLEKAEKYVKTSFRSVPKQIEFWANIGQEVESIMTPADLAALANGEVEVKIFRKRSLPVDMDEVFSAIEQDRRSGVLSSKVVRDNVWYEESKEHPGYLIRMNAASGKRVLGNFEGGVFRIQKSHKNISYRRNSKTK